MTNIYHGPLYKIGVNRKSTGKFAVEMAGLVYGFNRRDAAEAYANALKAVDSKNRYVIVQEVNVSEETFGKMKFN